MIAQTVSGVRFLVVIIVIGITTENSFGLNRNVDQLPEILENKVYDQNIRTVWLGSVNWEFSMPVIELNSDQKLELRFDDLSGDSRLFGYTFIHCNADWKRSQLTESEYLAGFGKGLINNSKQSFNTTRFYLNYRIHLPEDDCIPVISGNYVVVVYEETDPEKIILTRRFFITEKTMDIEAAVRQPGFGAERQAGQQVHFSVLYDASDIRDPQKEISAIVIQNNRFDNVHIPGRPYTFKPGLLDYSHPDGNIMNAGNEFRSLDIKSMRYQTENIAAIDFRNPYYHVILKTGNMRANKPWFSKTDLNGNYYIDKEKSDDRHTEADYVYVHFILELPSVYSANLVYVAGAFNDWRKDDASLMKFNPESGLFEITMLLKQGLYDYCFMTENPENRNIDEMEIEGSFYETENDYSIFVYFHDQFKRYDRLTGYLSIK